MISSSVIAGKAVYLRDVATVVDTLESRVQENYTNGRRSASIVIQKQSGANTVDIANTVKKQLPELQKNLPPDIEIVAVMDSSDYIRVSIDSLLETILLALIIVGLVVLFFLGRWRATIIIMVAIPISLIGSFIYLYLTGNTINIISLSALSITIGLVVDDAIVVLENIATHLEREPPEAGGHLRNGRGFPFGYRFHVDHHCRLLADDHGGRFRRCDVQAVGLDGFYHHHPVTDHLAVANPHDERFHDALV